MDSDIIYNTSSQPMTNPYEYTTDSYGRIESVKGTLQSIPGKRNTGAQANVGWQYRRKGNSDNTQNDDGGHLIATIFNGDGDFANLVPMNSNLNRSAWKKMENTWAKLLKAGCEVKIEIKLKYNNNYSLRPDHFYVTTIAKITDDQTPKRVIFDFDNEDNQKIDEEKREELLEVLNGK